MGTVLVAGPDPAEAEAVALGVALWQRPVLVTAVRGAEGVPVVEADLTRFESVLAAVGRAVATWGPPDGVVALPSGAAPRPVQDMDDGLWRAVLDANLTAAMHVCRSAAPALLEAGGGVIALVTWEVSPGAGLAHLAAAAGAVCTLARALAVELGADNVRVNAVTAPVGNVRAALPALRLLLSKEAAYVTGEVISPRVAAGVGS